MSCPDILFLFVSNYYQHEPDLKTWIATLLNCMINEWLNYIMDSFGSSFKIPKSLLVKMFLNSILSKSLSESWKKTSSASCKKNISSAYFKKHLKFFWNQKTISSKTLSVIIKTLPNESMSLSFAQFLILNMDRTENSLSGPKILGRIYRAK